MASERNDVRRKTAQDSTKQEPHRKERRESANEEVYTTYIRVYAGMR